MKSWCLTAVKILILVGLIRNSYGAGTSACSGTGALVYDHWPPKETGFALTVYPSVCGPTASNPMTVVEVAELFVPEELPWQISKVCVYVYAGPATVSTVLNGTLTIYAVDYSTWTPSSSTILYQKSIQMAWPYDAANTFDISTDFKVFLPEFFVSVKFESCATFVIGFSSASFLPKQLAYYRKTAALPWTEWTQGSAFVLRTLGSKITSNQVPNEWTCDNSTYNSNDKCDCNCGIYDPDCLNKNLASTCATGSVCTRDAVCVTPSGWGTTNCPVSSFGTHDGCQCCSGDSDPDCLDPTQKEMCGSVPSSTCTMSTGVCTTSWTCPTTEYGDGICNCGDCGDIDIDCLAINNPSDCSDGSDVLCSSANECWLPRAWDCVASSYKDGVYCDCCKAFDPDCANRTAPLRSCTSGKNECTPNGICVTAGCNNGNLDTRAITEECDGGLGCSSCSCPSGYIPYTPSQIGCQPICNDSTPVLGEQCDGGMFCNQVNCTCNEGHLPYTPSPKKFCQGCGNGFIDPLIGEECDKGRFCDNSTCKCIDGYVKTSPISINCMIYVSPEPQPSSSSIIIHKYSSSEKANHNQKSSESENPENSNSKGNEDNNNKHSSGAIRGSSAFIPSNTNEFPVILVAGIAAGVVALLIVAAIVIAIGVSYHKHKKNESITAGGTEMGLIPSNSNSPTPQFQIGDKKFGLVFTPSSLDFGEQKLEQPINQILVVRNKLETPVIVTFNAPSDIYHAIVVVDPIRLELGSAGSKTCSSQATVTLTMKCTTNLSVNMMVTSEGIGYCMLPIAAIGSKSRVLDPDSIVSVASLSTHGDYIVSTAKCEGKDVVLKEVRHAIQPEMLVAMHAEIEKFATIRSTNIMPALYSAANSIRTCLIVEYAPMGSVETLISGGKILDSRTQIKFALDCARGMNILHENHFIHGNLRPCNMMLFSTDPSEEICVKVADFGAVGVLHRMPLSATSMLYVAPEILHAGIPPTQLSDIFAFGVTLLYMSDPGMLARIANSGKGFVDGSALNGGSGPLQKIMIRCLSLEPASRGSFSEILAGIKEVVHALPPTLASMPVK